MSNYGNESLHQELLKIDKDHQILQEINLYKELSKYAMDRFVFLQISEPIYENINRLISPVDYVHFKCKLQINIINRPSLIIDVEIVFPIDDYDDPKDFIDFMIRYNNYYYYNIIKRNYRKIDIDEQMIIYKKRLIRCKREKDNHGREIKKYIQCNTICWDIKTIDESLNYFFDIDV